MIEVYCPSCDLKLSVSEQYLGRSGTCEFCRQNIILRRPLYVAAFDLETTGLNASYDEVIEVAGVLFDGFSGHVFDRFDELVHSTVAIHPDASKVNGISGDDLKDARSPVLVLKDFSAWVSRAQFLVAHNAQFDTEFLVAAARRYNLSLPDLPVVDTLEWARDSDMDVVNYKLKTLMDRVGATTERLHRAAADADGLRQVTMYLLMLTKDRKAKLDWYAESIQFMAQRRADGVSKHSLWRIFRRDPDRSRMIRIARAMPVKPFKDLTGGSSSRHL